MRKAVTIDELLSTKFVDIEFEAEWADSFGCPEMSGSWIIFGHSGNGKSSFAMQLAKELTKFTKTKVAYCSMEEKARKTMKLSIERHDMKLVKSKFQLLTDNITELIERLEKQKSADIVFIDSVQYSGLTKPAYINLKERFPKKLFIYISHAEGNHPKGRLADFIRYDSDIKIRIEGFKAIILTRIGGGKPFVIWPEKASEYWGDIND